ncbi:hypothetical protein EVG20_g7371 [Dentipellis fragilis]|uniref:Zn(2)-C6 fungal-type domain-containing protein n=1 Tax=Dentipellis fragilis TaxID=205917 RepID=A0A4Y9YGJ5_9AGAM|nr:hypothetical protein EVG20_g7371 [Dentipellis fragilis]
MSSPPIPPLALAWDPQIRRATTPELPSAYDPIISRADIYIIATGQAVVAKRCNQCFDRKKPCSRGVPRCAWCTQRGLACVYGRKDYDILGVKKGRTPNWAAGGGGKRQTDDAEGGPQRKKRKVDNSSVPVPKLEGERRVTRQKTTAARARARSEPGAQLSGTGSASKEPAGDASSTKRKRKDKASMSTQPSDPPNSMKNRKGKEKAAGQVVPARSVSPKRKKIRMNTSPADAQPVESESQPERPISKARRASQGMPSSSWRVARTPQASKPPTHPILDVYPRVWTCSRAELMSCVPALSKTTNGIVYEGRNVPIVLLQDVEDKENELGKWAGDTWDGRIMSFSIVREITIKGTIPIPTSPSSSVPILIPPSVPKSAPPSVPTPASLSPASPTPTPKPIPRSIPTPAPSAPFTLAPATFSLTPESRSIALVPAPRSLPSHDILSRLHFRRHTPPNQDSNHTPAAEDATITLEIVERDVGTDVFRPLHFNYERDEFPALPNLSISKSDANLFSSPSPSSALVTELAGSVSSSLRSDQPRVRPWQALDPTAGRLSASSALPSSSSSSAPFSPTDPRPPPLSPPPGHPGPSRPHPLPYTSLPAAECTPHLDLIPGLQLNYSYTRPPLTLAPPPPNTPPRSQPSIVNTANTGAVNQGTWAERFAEELATAELGMWTTSSSFPASTNLNRKLIQIPGTGEDASLEAVCRNPGTRYPKWVASGVRGPSAPQSADPSTDARHSNRHIQDDGFSSARAQSPSVNPNHAKHFPFYDVKLYSPQRLHKPRALLPPTPLSSARLPRSKSLLRDEVRGQDMWADVRPSFRFGHGARGERLVEGDADADAVYEMDEDAEYEVEEGELLPDAEKRKGLALSFSSSGSSSQQGRIADRSRAGGGGPANVQSGTVMMDQPSHGARPPREEAGSMTDSCRTIRSADGLPNKQIGIAPRLVSTGERAPSPEPAPPATLPSPDPILDINANLPPTPPEIAGLLETLKVYPAQLVVASTSPLVPWTLPEDVGYFWAGLFKLEDVEEHTQMTPVVQNPTSKYKVQPRVLVRRTWRLVMRWVPGGEELLVDDEDEGYEAMDWGSGKAVPDQDEDDPMDNAADSPDHPADILDHPSGSYDNDLAASDEEEPPIPHTAPLDPFTSTFLPLPILAPFTALASISSGPGVFPSAFFCAHCGRLNPQRYLRHRRCVCRGPREDPNAMHVDDGGEDENEAAEGGWALSAGEVRDACRTAACAGPDDAWNAEAGVQRGQTGLGAVGGRRVYQYAFEMGESGNAEGGVVSHLFTANMGAVQAEPNALFMDIQRKVWLERELGGVVFEKEFSGVALADEGCGVPECIRTTASLLMRSVEGCPIRESDAHIATRKWSFERMCVQAWVAEGKTPGCFAAKAAPIALLCLGADIIVSFTGKKPPVLQASTIVKKGKKGAKNEALRVTLLHGDLLVMQGGDFEYTMTRTGMCIAILANFVVQKA